MVEISHMFVILDTEYLNYIQTGNDKSIVGLVPEHLTSDRNKGKQGKHPWHPSSPRVDRLHDTIEAVEESSTVEKVMEKIECHRRAKHLHQADIEGS